jgi:hypothetical protein
MGKNKIETYSTYDLGLATALVTWGYELVDMDKENPKKVSFVFKVDENIDGVVDDFFNNKLMVSASQYFNNQKMLKNRIYD